ncbi:hypothetical protein MY8738_002469, partial [Beauveria namnaoensis]
MVSRRGPRRALKNPKPQLHHARLAQAGYMKRDPVNESISLELDFLNIFNRMVQISSTNQRR